MMMFDRRGDGDGRFQKMMRDFIQTHYNKDVSTEDFKQIVEKHITLTPRDMGIRFLIGFLIGIVYLTVR